MRVVPTARAVRFDLRWALERDMTRGWHNAPGAGRQFTSPEYSHDVSYNAESYRGALVPHARTPGVHRVVMLGDSFTDGFSVPLEARVSARLDARLAAAGLPTDTVALGTSGYGTDQEMLWLRDAGWDYRPDVVVVMFYQNDVWEVGERRPDGAPKPTFHLEGGRLAEQPLTPSELVPAPRPKGVEAWLDSHSQAYALAKATMKNSPRLRALGERLGLLYPVDPMWALHAGVQGDLQVFARHPAATIDDRWRLVGALLAAMRDDCAAHGVPLVVFHVPARIAVEHDEWTRASRTLGLPEAEWDPAEVDRRLASLCDEHGLRCVEPHDAFVRAAASTALYYRIDAHWNAAGHDLAAAVLAERLRALWAAATGAS
ncbi:MAG: SGNH/GDSL hydrolase family protein [Vicinamibacterales bacterium]